MTSQFFLYFSELEVASFVVGYRCWDFRVGFLTASRLSSEGGAIPRSDRPQHSGRIRTRDDFFYHRQLYHQRLLTGPERRFSWSFRWEVHCS
jgi:hypothetical protein